MNKLSIKRVSEKGTELNGKNYEILADGRKIDTTNLQSIDIDTYFGDAPAITLRYEPQEIEVELNLTNNEEYMLCKKQVGEYAKKVLDEAKRELPKSATSNLTEVEDKNEDYMTCVINFDRGKWITEYVFNHHYERLGAYNKSITFNYEQNRIEVDYNIKTGSDIFCHCLDKYKIGETITVIDGVIQKEMNGIEVFNDA